MNWFALTPHKDLPPPAFGDAGSLQTWIAQAKRDVNRYGTLLVEQLDRLQALPLDGATRAPLLELLRPEVVHAAFANRAVFGAQARPLPPRPFTAFSTNQRLFGSLTTGYLQCAEDFLARNAEPGWIAIAAHRAMIGIRLAIEDHYFAGMEAPPLLWQRAFSLVMLAQVRRLQAQAVPDPLQTDLGSTTVAQVYAMTVLTSLTDPYGVGTGELALVQRLAARWRDLPTFGITRDDDDKKRWVNLRQLEMPSKSASKEPAWMDVGQVMGKLAKRIEALKAGQSPEELHLGKVDPGHALGLLERMRRKLHEAYDPAAAPQAQLGGESIFVTCGVEEGYSLITGARYNANPVAGAGSDRVLNERMAVFGRHSVITSLATDKPKFGDEWSLSSAEGEHLRIVNSVDAVRSPLAPGMLITLKQDNSFRLGRLTRAVIRQNGKMEVSLTLLAGEARATESHTVGSTAPIRYPLLLLSAVPERQQPMIALLPSGAAVAPRQVMATKLSGAQQITLGPALDRGPNYDAYRVDVAR